MAPLTRELLQAADPPKPFYNNGDRTSFAYKSAQERWPVILAQVVDDVHRRLSSYDESDSAGAEAVAEGKAIISAVDKLKYDESRDRPLEPLDESCGSDVAAYNEELAILGDETTWFNVPWLFSECYLYRRLRILFQKTRHWQSYDPFARSKDSTFRSSRAAVAELALRYRRLCSELESHPYADMGADARRLLWLEMAQISLWGNATDLSLLTNLSYEDLQKLQGAEAITKSQENILANDLDAVWRDVLIGLKGGRVDIVLDNAGFELFADLILATYLLETGHADVIVLHPKDFAWFVSDVTPADVAHLFNALSQGDAYFSSSSTPGSSNGSGDGGGGGGSSDEEKAAMQFMTDRWLQLYAQGKFAIRPNAFWTTAQPFARLPSLAAADAAAAASAASAATPVASTAGATNVGSSGKQGDSGDSSEIEPSAAQDCLDELRQSDLCIFKGDLNYRKLVADAMWVPYETSFSTALGDLAHAGVRVLALRTCKADVVVGLHSKAQVEKLDEKHGRLGWRTSGKFAVVQFHDGKADSTTSA